MYTDKCKVDVAGTMVSELSGHPVVGDGVDYLSTQCEKITSQDVCTGPCHIKKFQYEVVMMLVRIKHQNIGQ